MNSGRFSAGDWREVFIRARTCLAMVCVLAMGDLGVIALFGTTDSTTLPLLLYQQLGAYRTGEAAVSAGLLLVLCLAVFWLIERVIGGRDA